MKKVINSNESRAGVYLPPFAFGGSKPPPYDVILRQKTGQRVSKHSLSLNYKRFILFQFSYSRIKLVVSAFHFE